MALDMPSPEFLDRKYVHRANASLAAPTSKGSSNIPLTWCRAEPAATQFHVRNNPCPHQYYFQSRQSFMGMWIVSAAMLASFMESSVWTEQASMGGWGVWQITFA